MSAVCVVECLVVVWSCGRASPTHLPLSFLYLCYPVPVCVCMFMFFSHRIIQSACPAEILQCDDSATRTLRFAMKKSTSKKKRNNADSVHT